MSEIGDNEAAPTEETTPTTRRMVPVKVVLLMAATITALV